MGEIAEGVAASAVRAARDVRVVVGRLRRRLKETYDIGDLTPPNANDRPSWESPLRAISRVTAVDDQFGARRVGPVSGSPVGWPPITSGIKALQLAAMEKVGQAGGADGWWR